MSLIVLIFTVALQAAPKKPDKHSGQSATAQPVLWQDPVDIGSRDMIDGPGGPDHRPRGPFRFVKEDLDGTSAKFVVTDGDGTKWKVKLGAEAHPETVASRLVWAVGYFSGEDYYLPVLDVQGLPSHLKRGESYVDGSGGVHGARLKRYLNREEKEGHWEWRANPFFGSREFNGLRVMMALINNWDLKDENNGVYEYEGKKVYLVTDLGASFGTTSRRLTRDAGKGNLQNYEASRFIENVDSPFVSFGTPSRPAFLLAFDMPDFKSRLNMEWIGKKIPIDDARWIGSILARLSQQQIEAAFSAAGYSEGEVKGFSHAIEERIGALNRL